jgi:hypothetical protein
LHYIFFSIIILFSVIFVFKNIYDYLWYKTSDEYYKVVGFCKYLKTAEFEKIKFDYKTNPANKSAYYKLLPYVVALDFKTNLKSEINNISRPGTVAWHDLEDQIDSVPKPPYRY